MPVVAKKFQTNVIIYPFNNVSTWGIPNSYTMAQLFFLINLG